MDFRTNRLSSRAIIGTYYRALEQNIGASWVGRVSNYFTTDQPMESYAWLGAAPVMREWVGGRQARGLTDNGFDVKNRLFEATLEIDIDDLRRDKSGQIMVRVREMARRTNAHWASLLSTLILNGQSRVGYDGQFFFDTDHAEVDSGAQSNSISVDISGFTTMLHGTPSAPSVEELQLAITAGISALIGFKDDQGEPMNEDAAQFLVMLPPNLWSTGSRAVYQPSDIAVSQTSFASMRNEGYDISYVSNSRLSGWTDKFAIFRTDSEVKPLIRQEETGVQMKAIAEGSELEFKHRKHWYGVETWRNVAYGMWQNALLVTMV